MQDPVINPYYSSEIVFDILGVSKEDIEAFLYSLHRSHSSIEIKELYSKLLSKYNIPLEKYSKVLHSVFKGDNNLIKDYFKKRKKQMGEIKLKQKVDIFNKEQEAEGIDPSFFEDIGDVKFDEEKEKIPSSVLLEKAKSSQKD